MAAVLQPILRPVAEQTAVSCEQVYRTKSKLHGEIHANERLEVIDGDGDSE